MSEIRVTYAGLISFAIGLISVFTGLIFTLIVTRNLTPEEFGTWGLIGGLISYALIMGTVVNYWAPREIARGETSGKTALFSSSVFSVIAIMLYFILISIFGNEIVDQNILIFAVILVPVEFIKNILLAISLGHKPQNVEYGLLLFELTKIPVALLTVYYLDLGIIGAIIASTVASIANIILLLIRCKEKISGVINKKYFKKWIKLFWLPTYPKIAGVLANVDVAVFTLLTGNVAGLAFWVVSKSISKIVGHSSKINKAVYPKLLSGGKKEYLQENVVRVFYFTLPLAALVLAFNKPALFALNPLYIDAAPIIVVMVPVMVLQTFYNIFGQGLSGTEKVDTNKNSTFIDYLKSKLFYLPTIGIIQRVIYLVALVSMLIIMIPITQYQIDLVLYWSFISLGTQLPFTVYLYYMVKREFHLQIKIKIISKYLLASIISFGIAFVLMEEFLIYENQIMIFLPNLFQFIILGGALYLGITYIIDSKTKSLFKSVFKEIKK